MTDTSKLKNAYKKDISEMCSILQMCVKKGRPFNINLDWEKRAFVVFNDTLRQPCQPVQSVCNYVKFGQEITKS